ncbi:hypothetical protein IAG44_06880 [Streptomyces roseirectus]|uniref:Uncharacterized protein n=1 Tax=Streptomyces roseirectus TaxID=2768066 RepID=A0A7H0I8S7_9ACTN|nr:hypothetical protein [Streptomyces roseirectus]QNP69193.1 hypothetical protein IAG44_06880 [Streptomyces roseirectus]
MGLQFHDNEDGTFTGCNDATGFSVTSADEEEVRRLVHKDARRPCGPRLPPPAEGLHRFVLVHEEFEGGSFDDDRYDALRANPPTGCTPINWGCFALSCDRPGRTMLDAITETLREIRRDHGLVMNSLGTGSQEWMDDGKDGYGAQIVAHLVLMARYRAESLGYGHAELVRLLDATGV